MLSAETIAKIKARMELAGVREDDLRESFIYGSGAGGQKINKTSSTVRLHHLPSSTILRYGASRSREDNRWLARREMAEKLLEQRESELSLRRQRNEKIRRQKRRRSRRQQARIVEQKRRHGEKKAARAPIRPGDL